MPAYGKTLDQLAEKRPRLMAALRRSEEHRRAQIAALVNGARFAGVDELLQHLDAVANAFAADPVLARLSFLIKRSAADVETAVEATVSGYVAVAIDAMRDVMEIENLLLDFALEPAHVEEWLASEDRARRPGGKFSPGAVRSRLHKAGEGRYAASAESLDYKAHSAALHVSPGRHPVAAKGFSADVVMFGGDAGYWELFEHAQRLRRAIRRLTGSVQPGSPADTLAEAELPAVDDACERTRQMQDIYLALLQASVEAEAGKRGRGAGGGDEAS